MSEEVAPGPRKRAHFDVEMRAEERKLGVNFNELKSGGFIKQTQKDRFTVRLRCPGGRLPLSKLKKIVEVAERYGGDYVHLSFRQSLEVPYVNIKDFDAMVSELREVGQEVASCGARVRVPTACSGCEYNPNGITDTQYYAQEVDNRYFGQPTPHKFKTSFSGCPIDCARTREADLGFQGQVEPVWDPETCAACTLCIKACQEGSLTEGPDRRPVYDPSLCIYCGDCIRACPTDSWTAQRKGHAVRVGGKHGRHPREANLLVNLLPNDKVFPLLETVLAWYREHGARGERIGTVIERVGLESLRRAVEEVINE